MDGEEVPGRERRGEAKKKSRKSDLRKIERKRKAEGTYSQKNDVI